MAEVAQQAITTSVSNLVVTPQVSGASISFNTGSAVRAQVQVGTASGTYTTFSSGIESVVGTSHLLYVYGLAANTTYHYILQFYGAFGGALDATADATFTTLAAPTGGPAPGVILGLPGTSLIGGNGVPANSMGNDGSFYFRWDGTAGAFIYHKAAGAWTAVI